MLCECATFIDGAACSAAFETSIAASQNAGLEYDADCAGSLDYRLERPIDGEEECALDRDGVPSVACEEECQVYSGSGTAGAPCTRYGRRMSTCSSDLTCALDGRCREPCERPMVSQMWQPCGYFSAWLLDERCAEGLVCDPMRGVCVPPLTSGEACEVAASTCPSDEWCSERDLACVPKRELGETCTEDAGCTSGVCVEVCSPPQPYLCTHPRF